MAFPYRWPSCLSVGEALGQQRVGNSVCANGVPLQVAQLLQCGEALGQGPLDAVERDVEPVEGRQIGQARGMGPERWFWRTARGTGRAQGGHRERSRWGTGVRYLGDMSATEYCT